MNTQHTPTPWSYRANHNASLDFFGEDGNRVILCNARLINQDANAAFIVRACNAHEQLVTALEMIRDADDDAGRDGLPRIPLMARARIDAALAAAGVA